MIRPIKSEAGEIAMLRRWMGNRFPKMWERFLLLRDFKQYALRFQALQALQEKHFKACRPVTVEVRAR